MKISFYISICFAFITCNFKQVNIWERTKETDMIPLGSYIMMLDDSVRLQRLIDEDEDILNQKDGIGCTLLYHAANENAIKCTRLLIAEKADVNIISQMGETTLMQACAENNFEIIKLLTEAGADVNAYNRAGNTPLTFAIIGFCKGKEDSLYQPSEETILYLIKNGANVNFKGGELQNTALDMARYFDAKPIEKILIENGAY